MDAMERRAPNLSEVALHSIIDESGVDSASTDRQKMLRAVLSLSDLAVKSVTIPRPEVTAISVDATVEEVFQTIRTSGYSRIPVYRKNLDNIVGILHAKDILPRIFERIQDMNRSREPMELVHVMRKPLFVPDSAKVDVTLKYMQKNHIHLAVVIDEHGGMEGIVTLEDLLEQIVGEIQDEHDFELDAIRHLPDESMLVDADISIREMNKRLKLRLPESSHYSTLAGFLLAQSGRILTKGEEVVFDRWKFLVVETEGRRLVKVRMERYLAESEPVAVPPQHSR
jgi:magnesium and cobalt exporter, CNNM family